MDEAEKEKYVEMAKNGLGTQNVQQIDGKSFESYVSYKRPEDVVVEEPEEKVVKMPKPKVSLGRPSVFDFLTENRKLNEN